MRATWIFFALAAATLIFVMVLRPGPGPAMDERPDSLPRGEAGPVVADGREARRESPRRVLDEGDGLRTEAGTRLQAQDENERPAGGYDTVGAAFHASDDYLAFVDEVIEAADGGDAAARYYIGRILAECQLAVRQFDGEYPDEYTLSTAIPDDMNPQVNDLMQRQVARCRGFFDEDMSLYGAADDWMRAAAEDGYGPAVMRQGISDYRMYQAGRSADFDPDQLVQVLRDRNPDTLAYASQLSAIHGDSRADETAWLMLACEYGQDCSANSDWVQALCLQQGCPPSFDGAEDALSVLLTPGELEQARDRMAELERALDAGDFDGLFR
ncbi:hypothetical protein [Natronospira bacteriovora]|uniref:Sel1 repeat family protein n=1 Tax=Natronospira bacteriovora TaxID=3069753 RepID=A0ABU0W6Z9_9GAMM|nr:hypothetical protein [Natronospira sp. AB-CW4]MDQ2069784.1 hypothetical protein [Natronospira sp. AB-CW4]